MREVRLLTGLYLKSLFGLNRLKHSRDKADRRKFYWLCAGGPLLLLLLMGSVGAYCVLMSMGLSAMGQPAAMPVTMFTLAGAFTLITCALKGGEMLLGFKDYDLQASMPLSPRAVAASRLAIQYVVSMLTVLAIMLPAGAVYAYFARPGFAFYPVFLACTLALPLLPSVVGSVLGALILRVSSRFRASRYLNIVFLFAFMGLYMYGVFRMNMQSEEAFGALAINISQAVTGAYPPARLFAGALNGDVLQFLLFLALSAGVFALAAVLFARNMLSLRNRVTEKRARRAYQMRALRESSPVRALFRREMGRYFASSIYVLNTLFGVVMALLAAVAVLVLGGREGILALIGPEQGAPALEMITAIAPFALGFLTATCSVTASSISMEGLPVWIIKSIPVRAWDILLSKLLVNFALLAPACVPVPLVLIFVLQPDPVTAFAYVAMPTVYGVFISLFGLWMNLRMHRFDWKTETEIVKQSAPVGFAIFAGMLLSFAPGFACTMLPGLRVPLIFICLGITALLSVFFAVLLKKRAETELLRL